MLSAMLSTAGYRLFQRRKHGRVWRWLFLTGSSTMLSLIEQFAGV